MDNGCLPETKQTISSAFKPSVSVPYTYRPLCNNPGYAAGNNEGAKSAAESSKWLLLLNDDVVLGDEHFIQNMVNLGEAKPNAAAVGCKLTNADGTELIEAGSIIWRDASTAGFGRGRHDVDAPEFSSPRPVDYISGACLMTNKDVFKAYGGFDQKNLPSFYEDTDFQMHIQHDLGREVWLEPLAVARHEEHASFGNDESVELMQKSSKVFMDKWKPSLKFHVDPPFILPTQQQQDIVFLTASDLRARDINKANILYLDGMAPNKSRGSGFGRSFDNLSMIAGLGHRITLATLQPPTDDNWCDKSCVKEITELGIEYVTTKWDDLFANRVGFYDIVLVSRPSTFRSTYDKMRGFYAQHPFSLVYDCEALWYRRNTQLMDLVTNGKIQFPGAPSMTSNRSLQAAALKREQELELALLSMADAVVPVSGGEAKLVSELTNQI